MITSQIIKLENSQNNKMITFSCVNEAEEGKCSRPSQIFLLKDIDSVAQRSIRISGQKCKSNKGRKLLKIHFHTYPDNLKGEKKWKSIAKAHTLMKFSSSHRTLAKFLTNKTNSAQEIQLTSLGFDYMMGITSSSISECFHNLFYPYISRRV